MIADGSASSAAEDRTVLSGSLAALAHPVSLLVARSERYPPGRPGLDPRAGDGS